MSPRKRPTTNPRPRPNGNVSNVNMIEANGAVIGRIKFPAARKLKGNANIVPRIVASRAMKMVSIIK